MPDHLDAIDRELSLLLRPLAKAAPQSLPQAEENEPARLRFKEACDKLDGLGWSWERIARYLGCARTTVIAVYKGHRYVPARYLDALDNLPAIKALPTQLRVAQLRKVS